MLHRCAGISRGLETQEKLNEHRATVLKFMDKRQAICIKDENEIAGVMLFSRGHNMICYLAVSPEYRRRGVASILMDEVLTNLDRTKEISVSTFRADDEKGTAPRALYEKYHLSPDDDYPEFKYYEGLATVYKGNIIKNLIMDCQSYTKYRPNETTGGIFVSWRRKEELPTGA